MVDEPFDPLVSFLGRTYEAPKGEDVYNIKEEPGLTATAVLEE